MAIRKGKLRCDRAAQGACGGTLDDNNTCKAKPEHGRPAETDPYYDHNKRVDAGYAKAEQKGGLKVDPRSGRWTHEQIARDVEHRNANGLPPNDGSEGV